MSYMLMVFCRRPIEAITRQEIAQAIVEAVFFADTPKFDPPVGSEEARAPEWDTLVIRYSDAKRPVVLTREGKVEGIDEDIEDDFDKRPLDPALQRQLVEAKQVFTLDVDQAGLTDEAWEMCDWIEHHLAERCDGLIYAPGDGIFDATLQPLAKTGAT
jgi:hypothetical protein